MGKKALLTVAATALTVATTLIVPTVEAFQPLVMVSSIGKSGSFHRSLSTKLNYAVVGGDQAKADITGVKKNKQPNQYGYIVNHDNERSFWLHALQNLKSRSKYSSISSKSLWTRIACAYAPNDLRETFMRIPNEAVLVRVGDTDLDIALAVPSDSWEVSHLELEGVVSATKDARSKNQLVTIRVDFPEGSSFDKNAFAFEEELIAVINQVRLLEKQANERLSSSSFEGEGKPQAA